MEKMILIELILLRRNLILKFYIKVLLNIIHIKIEKESILHLHVRANFSSLS